MSSSEKSGLLNAVSGRGALSGLAGGRLTALLRRCGMAPRRAERPAGARFSGLDQLEGRILLGGDHPSFELPLTPTSGTLITLDGGGEGSDTGVLEVNGDQDLFRFTAPADDFVTVWADTINAGSPLNSRVEVYSADGPPPIASGSNNGNLTGGMFRDGWAGFVAEAGQTYYILVMSDVVDGGAGSTGSYILRLDATSDATLTLNVDVNDRLFGQGTEDGELTFGGVAVVGSDTVFKVTTGADDLFDSLATISAVADPDDLDTRLDVYDATGALVTFDSETGRLTNAFTQLKSGPEQTYYIRIRSDTFTLGDPEAVGEFTLEVDFGAIQIPVDPVVRLGNSLDEFGEVQDGLATTQDSTLFRFQAQGTGLSFITVVGLGPPSWDPFQTILADPAIRLYDDQGEFVAFNKLFGAAQIEAQLVGGRTYFVVVEAFDDAEPNPAAPGLIGYFGLFVHANYTFDDATPVDDHANRPDFNQDIEEVRRQFDLATPLVWNTEGLLTDGQGNPIADRSYFVTALGTGRIHEAGDRDLFSFVPPMDMLGAYGGDDGNQDISMFVGGAGEFTLTGTLNAPDHDPFLQSFLAILDAPGRTGPQKWWNADGGVNGTVRALTAFDPDGDDPDFRPMMVAGGEFSLAGGQGANRIAAWEFNPFTGAFEWAPMGAGLPGTVRALQVWDEDGEEGDNPPALYAGGDFGVARWVGSAIFGGAWTGTTATDGPVNALALWDPADIGGDIDPLLVAGGEFTDVDGTAADNLAQFDGAAWQEFNGGTNGPVLALSVWDPADPEGGPEEPARLVAGGAFTTAMGIAASNIASGTIIDDPNNAGNPLFVADDLGGGVNDTVRALASWDRDGDEEDFVPVLVAGGDFNDVGSFVAAFDGGWAALGNGMDAPVHSLTVALDFEYNPFDIDPLGNVFNEPRLFAGGEFTEADGAPALRVAKFEVDQFSGLTFWIGRAPGTTDTVYALAGMNDEVPGLWDRADREAPRLQVRLFPTTESFLNTFLTIFDSNFNIVYTNETIAPPFPDPSGSNDPSNAPGTPFVGIPVWGGETYYLEVSGQGTGRYQFSVRTDAPPPDLDDDQVYDDTISQYFEVPEAGSWDSAPELTTDGLGDGRNFIPLNTAAYNGRVWDATPSGFRIVQAQELSVIERIDDSDLYQFRAPVDGTVEIRINTTQLADQNYERIIDLVTGQVEVNNNTNTYNSKLDAKLSIFRNDFVLIAENDTNAAIQGEYDETYAGAQADTTRRFFRRDPRVVFNVTAGDVYFIQVESGQAATFAVDPAAVDWRNAIGSYELLLNAEPDLDFDDDHANTANGNEAMIPIDEVTGSPGNGTGSITGIIDDTLANPADQDAFGFIAPGSGVVTLTVNADQGSAVIPSVTVIDQVSNQTIAQGTAGGNGQLTLTFPATKGDRLIVGVTGAGVSEGAYTVTVSGVPFIDDRADIAKWLDASELLILDFLGTATALSSIEAPGDTDLYRFTTPDFDIATVTVTRAGGSLDTFVRIYEVSVDPAGNAILLQVAFNDDFGGSTDSQTRFSLTAPDRTSFATGNTYNTYYIAVSGNDAETQSGAYQLVLNVTPTDDHPDAGQFDFATTIIVDPATGLGADTGELEESGDTDLFQFTAPAGGVMTIDIGGADASRLRPLVRVFDVNQDVVLDANTGLDSDQGDDAIPSGATFTVNVVRNQTYYILVEGVAGGANTVDFGGYTVSLTGPTVDDHANITEFDLATQVVLSVITGDGLSAGLIGVEDDTDLFFFDTLKEGTQQIAISTPDSAIVARLRVFDGSQTLLADVVDGSAGDEDGSLNGAVVYTVNALAEAERYYFLVSADAGGDATGSYSVFVDGQAPDNPPPGGDDDHADSGEFDLASAIALSALTGDGSAIGTVDDPADTDLFVFSSLAAGRAFVQIITPEGSLLDTAVRIYDPTQTQIAADTEGVPGANASVSFATAGASQLYYIEVDGLGAGVGSYTVRVNTQPEVNYLYFPEGYVNASISEFVSIANPNAVAATYTVTLYYEDPTLAPVVLESNVALAAGARGGLTLARDGQVFYGIESDKPYSLAITSDQPLGATFAHYDFGQALGESFTERTSSVWTFARAERASGFVNDFIVFFNPNAGDVTVTLTAFTDSGLVVLNQTVGANRRGGWNLDAQGSLPQGAFGIRLTSAAANGVDAHIGIVAALSHYSVAEDEGDLTLGDPDGGAEAGILPSLTFGPDNEPQLTFFNASASAISVSIRGTYINANLPTLNRIIAVGARSIVTLEASEIGLISNQPLGLRYTSTGPVTILGREATLGDSGATAASTSAGSSWFFGDGFINADSAGITYFETLNFYNPDASAALPVTVSLFFNDGTSASTVVNVGADGFAAFNLHEFDAILDRGGFNFFSVVVTASRPLVATMTHYDLFLGGGWTSAGAPLGLLNELESIL